MKKIAIRPLFLAAIGIGTLEAEAAFTPGNLVVVQVSGTGARGVSLVEYTPSGSLVGTYPVTSSGPSSLTLNSGVTEGTLTQTPDGKYLSFAGYRADAGGTIANSTPRVISRLDTTTNAFNTDTQLTGVFNSSVRGAATTNGTDYWVSGDGNASNGGLRYVAGSGFGTAATSVSVVPPGSTNNNDRSLDIVAGQLFVASATGASTSPNSGVHAVGTGTPTSDTAYTNFTGTSRNVQSFYFADLSPSAGWNSTGLDTLYFTTPNANVLVKYSFNGSAWVENNTVALTGISNVSGSVTGGIATLYATTTTGGIFTLTDTAGYGASLAGADAFSAIAGAAPTGDAAFRGITVLVPEPTSLAAIAVGSLTLSRRRRSA